MAYGENPNLLDTHNQGYPQSDIELRDIFAAFALLGVWRDSPTLKSCAEQAYRIADAMLEEREK